MIDRDASVNAFLDRLDWDPERGVLRDGPARYVVLRADSLMGLFREIEGETRQHALDALRRATARAGGDSLARYRATSNLGDADFVALVERTAAELGWGRLRFATGPDRLGLEVRDSPFAAAFGSSPTPVCAPLAGILEAVAAILLDRAVAARETACAAQGAPACRFAAD